MSIRHQSRKILIQTMYELDIKGELTLGVDVFKDVLGRNIKDKIEGDIDQKFTSELGSMVHERLSTVDEIIKKAAPEWPIEKINVIDRNVLRLGLTELLFGDKINVPPKVAIDESIELAKEFGGETTGKFVNGVLGAVYRELGEPGKDSVKKSVTRTDYKAGAFVFAKYEECIYVALVLDVFGYWTLSKGTVENGEDSTETAKREASEELGLKDIRIIEKLADHSYIAHNPEHGKVIKSIVYFLAEADFTELKVGDSDGLVEAKWHKISEIADLKKYKDMRPILDKAIERAKEIN